MPQLPNKICSHPGCNTLVLKGKCKRHANIYEYDKHRENSHQRGYTRKWGKARRLFLTDNPLCVRCKAEGVIRQANVVDHIKPHKGDMELFWNESNWQALCKPCHDTKTATEDGGFGNTKSKKISFDSNGMPIGKHHWE